MAGKGIGTNVICQIAVVVQDIERAARRYAEIFGLEVPSWHLTAPKEETNIRYRGEPTEARAKLAFLQMGPQLNIELIEPVGAPSVWQEHLDSHGEGIHHIAFRVQSMDEALAYLDGEGVAAVQRGDFTGGQYTYVDSAADLGVMLELLASTPHNA
jgi:catechol 2,3-dioxygenase-like lactoylglutathione lyase family enzyme